MDLFKSIDIYCERLDIGIWAEPINAVTNVAFILASIFMWLRCKNLVEGRVLSFLLFSIGCGSFLFHTFAQTWAAILDVAAILIFILTYIFIANHSFLAWSKMVSLIGVILFFPYQLLLANILSNIQFFGSSVQYIPIAILIFIYSGLLRKTEPNLSRGLLIGATILCLSIVFRIIDEPLCSILSVGTHFVWHILNAIMLSWMIEILRRHMLAGYSLGR
ncbi:ceramidase [Paracoccaceae bacterium]|nr:ceramidase [Paracoccaceae bacterium]